MMKNNATSCGLLFYIIVKSKSKLISPIPIIDDVKKGKTLYFEFNKNVVWEVWNKKNADSTAEIVYNGTGTQASFKLNKAGSWWLNADNEFVWSGEVEGGLFNFSWFNWWYVLIGVGVLFFIYLLFIRKTGEEKESGSLVFSPNTSSSEEE